MGDSEKANLVELTADIVSAYVGHSRLATNDLPELIRSVYAALGGVSSPVDAPVEIKTPAVSIKKSITDDYLICLEDGRRFKSLKRHLRTKYDLTPEAYREKWGLPKSYPMVSPAYAAARSVMAKAIGLGQGGRQLAKAASAAKPAKAKPAPKA